MSNLSRKIINDSRRFIAVFLYIFIVGFSYILAFYVRFDFTFPEERYAIVIKTLPALILIKLMVFYMFGIFSGMWRYVGIEDLVEIVKANLVSMLLFVLYCVFSFHLRGLPRSVILLDWVFCTGIICGIRLLTRILREQVRPMSRSKTINGLIVGAGEAGVLVLKELKKNLDINVVGFVDDDPMKKGKTIYGKKVFGGKNDIKLIVEKEGVEEIIIAMPRENGVVIRDIVSKCGIPGVGIKIVPGMFEILSGEKELKVREVQPEDLLGRESVQIDKKEIGDYLKGKVILVTGAAGSIGSEIVRQVAAFSPSEMILVDYNENDLYFLEREIRSKFADLKFSPVTSNIAEEEVLRSIFLSFRPEVVFHAAAFKHVPLMEENAASAVKNNVMGTRNLIYAADHYGAEKFILISSDKAVNPTNVMGATKRMAEMILQAKSKKSRTSFIAVRFGNVLGSKGSVVPLFKRQIEEEGKVTVTHPEARRYFMSIREAVLLVLETSIIGKNGEILILDMGEQINIVDFARNLIRLSGFEPEKDIAIEYIGLRPGEKLYEEILHDAEKDKATRHERIFVAQPEDFDIKVLRKQIKELELLAKNMDNGSIKTKLGEIVRGYKIDKYCI